MYEMFKKSVVEDKIVTKEEYISAVVTYENLSYSEVEKEMEKEATIARVPAESVVTISRTVTKKVNSNFKLRCTAYLQVVRDNKTNKYIEELNDDEQNSESFFCCTCDLFSVGRSMDKTLHGTFIHDL